jgi:hypothetical protein
MSQTEAGMHRRTIRKLDERERKLLTPEVAALLEARQRADALTAQLGRVVALLGGRDDAALNWETGELFVMEPRPEMTAAGVARSAQLQTLEPDGVMPPAWSSEDGDP